MIFRKAEELDLEAVHALYRSLVGRPFCVWDDQYPSWTDINEDFENSTLYVMTQENAIVGAISIVVHNELDDLPFWAVSNAREIARVAVSPQHQGKGIAKKMVVEIAATLQSQSVGAVHLLVAAENPPAQQVYRKCGFQFLGNCFLFGHDYIACEKKLKND